MNKFLLSLILLSGFLHLGNAAEFTDSQSQYLPTEMLVNPGLENGKTGWTTSTDGPAATITTPLSTATEFGKRNGSFRCNGTSGGAGTCKFIQDVTTTISSDGYVAGYLKVPTGAVVAISSRKNGVVVDTISTTTDPRILDNDAWIRYEIPSITGTTSTGIEIAITVGGSDDITILGDKFNLHIGKITSNAPLITGRQAYTPAFTGFGTPTGVSFEWFQVGSSVHIEGRFTTGTPTGVEARISLPNNYISSSSIVARKVVGSGSVALSTTTNNFGGVKALIEPSVGYLTFGIERSASAGITKDNGTEFGTGSLVSFYAIVPVQGLSNSINTYTQQCQSDLECADRFTFNVSPSGVVTGDTLDIVNGNAVITDTSTYTYTFNNGVFPVNPFCTVELSENANNARFAKTMIEATTDSYQVKTFATSTGTSFSSIANAHLVTCFRAGADFKPRRGIIGSFKHIPSTPNAQIKECFLHFGGASDGSICNSSPCTVHWNTCNANTPTRIGSGLYNVSWPDGTYKPNGRVHCNMTGTRSGLTSTAIADLSPFYKANSSGGIDTLEVRTGTYAANADGFMSIECRGEEY